MEMRYHFFDEYLLNHIANGTFEGLPNCRMSAYFAQVGYDYITGQALEKYHRELHHREPRFFGGPDTVENTVLLTKKLHKLIHSSSLREQKALLAEFNPTPVQLRMFNQLRFEAHMPDLPAISVQTVRPAA